MTDQKLAGLKPEHFLWQVTAGVAVIRLNRPDRKNPLTFDSYAELRDTFRDVVRQPFEAMMVLGTGVPTARLEVAFHAPSRLGDLLDWHLEVRRLDKSALDLGIGAHGPDGPRLTVALTLVHVNDKGRPTAWTDQIRNRIADFMEAT